MFKWCSYCQQFLGETSPFDNYSVTHGVCKSCKQTAVAGPVDFEAIRRVDEFFQSIWHGGIDSSNTHLNIPKVITESQTLGIRPIDLFVGVIQPVLVQIGRLFEECRITVAREHLFTSFSEALLTSIENEVCANHATLGEQMPVDCLLVCANGNYHTFGVRVVDFYLRQEGFQSLLFLPGLPTHEIVDLTCEVQPLVVGISLSMPDQLIEIHDVQRKISNSMESSDFRSEPKLMAGGHLIRDIVNPLEGFFCYDGNLDKLRDHMMSVTGRGVS